MTNYRLLRIAGEYAHLCSSIGWRFLDEQSEDFYKCHCYQPTDKFLMLQDRQAIKKDLQRGAP